MDNVGQSVAQRAETRCTFEKPSLDQTRDKADEPERLGTAPILPANMFDLIARHPFKSFTLCGYATWGFAASFHESRRYLRFIVLCPISPFRQANR